LSWSRNAELRNLFADILDEAARALEEPGGGRGAHVLRLAAADAALLGLDNLSVKLKTLSDRLSGPAGPLPPEDSLSRNLGTLARTLSLGGEVDRDLEALDRALSWRPAPAAAPAPGPPAEPAILEVPPPPAGPAGARVYLEYEAPEPRPAFSPGEAGPAPAVAAGRALLVDPAPVSRGLLARMMRRLRWDVREMESLAPALEAVAQGQADVLLLEARRLRVPAAVVMDEVRRRSRGRPLPVVFVVEETRAQDEDELLRAGAAALLHRPADEQSLRRTLDAVRPPGGSA